MWYLIRIYQDARALNKIIYNGKKEDMLFHLDAKERRIKSEISKGSSTEYERIDNDVLLERLYSPDKLESIEIIHRVTDNPSLFI